MFMSISSPVVHQNIAMLSGKRKQLVVAKRPDSQNAVYQPMLSYIIDIYAMQNFGGVVPYHNDKNLIQCYPQL